MVRVAAQSVIAGVQDKPFVPSGFAFHTEAGVQRYISLS
jgi:hypothetical protein